MNRDNKLTYWQFLDGRRSYLQFCHYFFVTFISSLKNTTLDFHIVFSKKEQTPLNAFCAWTKSLKQVAASTRTQRSLKVGLDSHCSRSSVRFGCMLYEVSSYHCDLCLAPFEPAFKDLWGFVGTLFNSAWCSLYLQRVT